MSFLIGLLGGLIGVGGGIIMIPLTGGCENKYRGGFDAGHPDRRLSGRHPGAPCSRHFGFLFITVLVWTGMRYLRTKKPELLHMRSSKDDPGIALLPLCLFRRKRLKRIVVLQVKLE